MLAAAIGSGSPAALAEQGTTCVTVLATGGAIAGAQAPEGGCGYKSGSLDITYLFSVVPNLDKLAISSGEQVVNIGSQDMDDEVWLTLAKRLGEVVKSPGTDTVEETGYFFDLTTKTDKPIVMVVLADQIDYSRNGVKTNTSEVQTFHSVNRGPAGVSNTGVVTWFAPLDKKLGRTSEFSVEGLTQLPSVDILYAHAGMTPDLIDAAVKLGAKGLVIAGVGDGNMTQVALNRVTAAARAGVVVVRRTRLASGLVYCNNEGDDDKRGLVASGGLSPLSRACC